MKGDKKVCNLTRKFKGCEVVCLSAAVIGVGSACLKTAEEAMVSTTGAMAQLVARSTPDRAVGSSSLSGLTTFFASR